MILFLVFLSSLVIFGLIMIKKGRSGFKKFGAKDILISILLIVFVLVLFYWHRYRSTVSYTNKFYNSTWNKATTISENKYGIMFDAGSTGSRIHVFKFQTDSNNTLTLEDSYFKAIKPGLSSYSEIPKSAANSLEPLLEHAKKYIPRDLWSSTPLALKATAGLRLLSKKAAKEILTEVESLFARYPFNLPQNGVSILEGDDEGLFSWFTVNFLNGNFNPSSTTVGVLDLGGGSTQITFMPEGKDLNRYREHPYVLHRKFYDRHLTIYTHSYLGLGTMSARFQILGGIENVSGGIPAQNLESFCLPGSWNGTWEYRGEVHKLKSLSSNLTTNRWYLCDNEAKKLINKYKVDKSFNIQDLNFYAISYFYDQLETQKVPKDSDGGYQVDINTYIQLAQRVCKAVDPSKPFECLDLCYISSLLTHGYNFPLHKTLTLRKKIQSYEIAWPLGAMFEVYDKFSVDNSSNLEYTSNRPYTPAIVQRISAFKS